MNSKQTSLFEETCLCLSLGTWKHKFSSKLRQENSGVNLFSANRIFCCWCTVLNNRRSDVLNVIFHIPGCSFTTSLPLLLIPETYCLYWIFLPFPLGFVVSQINSLIQLTSPPSSPAVNTARDRYMWLSMKERTSHVLSAAGSILPFSNFWCSCWTLISALTTAFHWIPCFPWWVWSRFQAKGFY